MLTRSLRTDDRQREKQALDRLCARKVKERDGHRCVLCHSREAPQWAHVFSRRYLNVRWDPGNSMVLCKRCHFRYTKRPEEWFSLMETRLGPAAFARLRARAMNLAKVDLAAIRLSLEAA